SSMVPSRRVPKGAYSAINVIICASSEDEHMTRVASTSGAEITGGANAQDLAQQLATLHEVGRKLSAGMALPEWLQLVVDRAVELAQAAGGGLCRYRPGLDRLEWVVTNGQAEALNGRLVERGQGVAGRAWAA